MSYKRVAVLRGGPSEEYSVSMSTGAGVLNALRELGYVSKDVVITKKGEWLENGVSRNPELILEAIDIAFIALHGTYGEDGQVQRILERKRIPFTGSRALSSAIAFNKELTKQTLTSHKIKMPRHRRVIKTDLAYLDEELPYIFSEVGSELFVKPVSSGSSLGAKYVPNEDILRTTLQDLLAVHDQVMVEEYIRGREATVGVLDNFRNEATYILPVVEIIPPGGEPLFSYENKYNGKSEEIVPGRFSYHEKSELAATAASIHSIIGCKHYSRSDFIVRDGEIYFLEINTLPGLTPESLFPKAADTVGLSYRELVRHLVETATV